MTDNTLAHFRIAIPRDRREREHASYWRDVAIEAAAQIVESYAATNPNAVDMARDIRALKG